MDCGGGGALALGSAAYFGVAARAERDQLTCKPHCSDDDLAPINGKLVAGDVALGAAVILAGIATYLFLSAPPSPSKPSPVVSTMRIASHRFLDDVRCEKF